MLRNLVFYKVELTPDEAEKKAFETLAQEINIVLTEEGYWLKSQIGESSLPKLSLACSGKQVPILNPIYSIFEETQTRQYDW